MPRTKNLRPRFAVRGHGPSKPVVSWRDLGREGPGRHVDSPWTKNGIFIQGGITTATKESGPGLPLERRFRRENPGLKKKHKFVEANSLCLKCNMLRAGHDRLMGRLK